MNPSPLSPSPVLSLPLPRASLLVAVLMVMAACAPAGPDGVPGNDTIRAEDLRADLFFLAGDGMEGRRTQTRGNALAAEFLASRFQRLGLEPGADGSFFQTFELMTMALGEDNALAVAVDGRPVPATMGRDATPLPLAGTGSAEGEVVFAGYGIVSEPLDHDDFAGHDFAGKVVLVLDHEPGEEDPESAFDGVITAEASRDWRKVLAAQQAGAAAVLFVQDIHAHPEPMDAGRLHEILWSGGTTRYTLASWMDRITIPVAQVAPALAEQLVAGTGRSLAELASAAATPGAAFTELPGARVSLQTSVQRTRLPDRNVVAMIPGSDPELADEVVLICAHYDHDGRAGERIFNGADDDGSGSVALLEIAEAYALAAEQGHRPRRSILLAAWNSEEVGLLGAWAYTESPLVPLQDVVATLNMDMIGRNEEVPAGEGRRFFGLQPQTAEENASSVHLMGYSYSSGLREAAVAANEPIGLTLEMELDDNPSQLLRRSDHWPFLQLGVPSLFFHTGLHPDYHRETDTPDRIEYGKMERIVRLVHALSWDLANRDDRPAQDERTGTVR